MLLIMRKEINQYHQLGLEEAVAIGISEDFGGVIHSGVRRLARRREALRLLLCSYACVAEFVERE